MKNLLLGLFLAIAGTVPLYLISVSYVQADNWGCQVILCLSNPGSATQYAECRPPIEKLWRELANGHSFPTCSGVGFQASRPGYEPYYCNGGYRLTTRYGDRAREASCISTTPQTVSSLECYSDNDRSTSAVWRRSEGRIKCQRYVTTRPNVRPQPHYVDVTIDGVGKQRVWY
ncbi:hypothetical protein [Sinorhizobium terangae]|uniref:hypothetical protein n=1 Tax=Sinorhizobium terangae TaxID=110322 RepID=UPI0024B0D5C4|nr:hypothetical protein [Sinorhizobium terangae]WFU50180.1 hypothetical protein QA637_25640 [Sinorhizobium terangae]